MYSRELVFKSHFRKGVVKRIYAFELWCWRRLLRVPWTARRSNQSILKEISPGCSLEGMMLKLKLHTLATSCKELTQWKRLWCWEGLGTGGYGDDRGWDGWMASSTWWTWVWVNSRSWWWTERPGVLQFMGSQRVRHDWATELNKKDILSTQTVHGIFVGTIGFSEILISINGIMGEKRHWSRSWKTWIPNLSSLLKDSLKVFSFEESGLRSENRSQF